MGPSLFALFVGINEYHPQSHVTELNGCINDIINMTSWLKENYQVLNPSIKQLCNHQATRRNVIRSFRQHLCANPSIKEGDIVMFYFSGHGSTACTATEFSNNDPIKQDETRVCYDSRLPGHYDLSDKEIAALLSEVKKNVHIVIIFDSCHSGSGARGIAENLNLGKSRFTPCRQNESPRPLNTYLLGEKDYYQQLKLNGQSITIPNTPHILLAACQRDQSAWETSTNQGLFSQALLNVLELCGLELSYYEVMTRVSAVMRRDTNKQQPAMQPFQYNPNQVFLRDHLKSPHASHLVSHIAGKWQMDYGAIHGMPTNSISGPLVHVALYDTAQVLSPKYFTYINEVKLNFSILDFQEQDTTKTYRAEILNLPDALVVFVSGTQVEKKRINTYFQENPSAFVQLVDVPGKLKYGLRFQGDTLQIIRMADDQVLFEIKESIEGHLRIIRDRLERIEKWERILRLENPDTKINSGNVEVRFYEEPQPEGEKIYHPGNNLAFQITQNDEQEWETLWYHLEAKNQSAQPYYIAMLNLNPDFAITVQYQRQKFPANSEWVVIDDTNRELALPETYDSATDVFKIIVSTEPFDEFKFEQPDLVEVQRLSRTRGDTKTESDWTTRTITITLTKQSAELGTEDCQRHGITFKGHPSFTAKLSFLSLHSHTRSMHPAKVLSSMFCDSDLSILPLTPVARGEVAIHDTSIIEISNIKNDQFLSEKPWEITLEQSVLAEDERVLPVYFDGEFVQIIGYAEKKENGGTCISVNSIPNIKDPTLPKSKNPGKALWFCLLKATGFRENAFKLRYVQYNEQNGKILLTDKHLHSKVDKASKILLILHGIIGDTRPFAKSLRFIQEEKRYDLVLTFDYENLNEPITKIASELNKHLNEVHLNGDDGKQLDIVAHSMGGLVSRYLIEHIRNGDSTVDRLIMVGTPNGGSEFGKIPGYLNTMNTLLGLSLNFFKDYIGAILPQIEYLNKALTVSPFVTVTLNNMAPNSELVELLKKPVPAIHTIYHVIAGDITNYKQHYDGIFSRYMDQLLLRVGHLVYRDRPNDIAVGAEEIKQIPDVYQTSEFDVNCHHLNYFQHEEGVKVLKFLLQ